MFSSDVFSIILVICFAGLLAYRASFLKEREIWHISFLQIIYLIVMPGLLFIVFNSYMQTIYQRQLVHNPFISDRILSSLILLSMLFTYGGKAIHSVTKMLSETALRYEQSDVAKLNKYFHLKFSHSLMYSGAVSVMIFLTLLELNHVPASGYDSLLFPLLRGLFGGLILVGSMYYYTHSRDEYVGRWADLKAVFIVIWLGMVLLLYSIWQADQTLKGYQLVIPVFSALMLILILNIGLVIRHIRRSQEKLTTVLHQFEEKKSG